MKEFGKAENIAVIDLLPYFREWQVRHGKALFLKYDGHWTEDGHEVAASIVSRALISMALSESQKRCEQRSNGKWEQYTDT